MVVGLPFAAPWDECAREIGLALQRARQQAGLSQEKVADAAGISIYTYCKLEHGESTSAHRRIRA